MFFTDAVVCTKRRRKPAAPKWRKVETKTLRSEGKPYMGYRRLNGVVYQDQPREARKLGPPCTSNECIRRKKRQCSRITEEQRMKVFELFWNQTSWDQRKTFVANHVQLEAKQKSYTRKQESRRTNTLKYHLTIEGEKIEVCKNLFLSTTSLGEYTVHSWLKKDGSSASGMSNCSQFNNHKRKTPIKPNLKEAMEFARKFLVSLPKMESHYARSSTKKLYLEPVFRSINELFQVYTEACKAENQKPLSRCTMSNLYHEMNLSIHPVKKDKCDLCVKHEVGQMSDEDWKKHVDHKNRARAEKDVDKKLAEQKKCIALTMDLQAVKVSPWVQANAIFYKTKLCCHNFTMYDLATRDVTCFWFDETAADMTASTFTSCILEYLNQYSNSTLKVPIILYSDGCTYQNRNVILSNALLDFAIENDLEIIQKFLVVGHTQMECDSVHSRIENELKGRDIYLPHDYIRFTQSARKNPFPYKTKRMKFTDFKNFTAKQYQRYTSIRPGKVTFNF